MLNSFISTLKFDFNVAGKAKLRKQISRRFDIYKGFCFSFRFKVPRPQAHRCFSLTCSKDLLIQTSHGGHGYWNVFKKTHQAKIPEILQLNALLVALRHSLAFENLV